MAELGIVDPSSDNVDPVDNGQVADPFSNEIDKIFGSGPLNDGAGDGKKPAGGQSSGGASDGDQVDYANMNTEQLARMFQSKYDSTKAELDKTSQKLKEYESLDDFIMSVYDDEEVRQAFIADIAPDLVKQKNPYDLLEEKLWQEFGADFVPDDEEAKKPLSKSWKYYKRVDDIYKEITEKKAHVPKSLTEIREARAAQKRAAEEAANDEKRRVLQAMKWGDGDYNAFAQWVGKLSASDLAKIYKFATSRSPKSSPNLAGTSGGTAQTPPKIMADLDKFFGK